MYLSKIVLALVLSSQKSLCHAQEKHLEDAISTMEIDATSTRKLEDLWTPDCSIESNHDKPPCLCRYPTNWDSDTCTEWFAKPWVQRNYNIEPESPNPRIIDGDPVSSGTYPWFAQARNGIIWGGCGGMLVAPEYVLTAAHCVGVFDSFIIGALCNGNNNCGQTSEEIQMSGQPISHPSYDRFSLDNDFALVKLQRRSTITPVPMDSDDIVSSYDTDKSLWPIGFGNQNPIDPQYPNQLYHVEVKYVEQDTCNNNYSGGITDNMMCAADPGQDSCQGDSGGPLMDRDNNKLVGIVSWGIGCALPNYPGVYSKISSQWTWIKDTICDGHSSPKPGFCDGVPPSPTPPSPSPPTPSPPSPSPPSPSPPTGNCVDTSGWVDEYGDGCDWYENEENRCEIYGDYFADANGITANIACCVCGGGTTNPSPNTNAPTKAPISSPTKAPVASPVTSAPVPSPVAPPSPPTGCVDTSGWVDEYGDGCDWYENEENRCEIYGDYFADANGITANMACCACGGGTSNPPPNNPQTIAPTKAPASSPVASPVAQPSNNCSDSPIGWYDSDGEAYNCQWYAQGTNCEVHGDDYADGNGITANMACCACGGGTTNPPPNNPQTNAPTKAPTSSPTLSPTVPPTSNPTVAPTSSPVASPVTNVPTTAPVSPPVTFAPVSAPVGCQDTEERFIVGSNVRSCKWAYNKPERRCSDQVSTLCPVSCANVTGNTCTPYDTIGKFTLPNGNQKTCNWVSVKDWRRCNNYVSHANCPVTCKVGV